MKGGALFIVPSRDLYSLSVRVFEAKKPRAVVKMTHGMEEHQSRYEEFATFLQENGYTVVTADMRGHGKAHLNLAISLIRMAINY